MDNNDLPMGWYVARGRCACKLDIYDNRSIVFASLYWNQRRDRDEARENIGNRCSKEFGLSYLRKDQSVDIMRSSLVSHRFEHSPKTQHTKDYKIIDTNQSTSTSRQGVVQQDHKRRNRTLAISRTLRHRKASQLYSTL